METNMMIFTSHLILHQGLYLAIFIGAITFGIFSYLRSAKGRYQWDRFIMYIPIINSLLRRIMLIRFSQSLSIILNSGLSIQYGLNLVKNIIENAYISQQIIYMS